jgi:hypothetical protein
MFEYLALSDGTTTLELTDGIDYALVSYAPGAAALRESLLGSAGPYDVVQDVITVHAMGTTAALAYAAADDLQTLLEQAFRWWQGERVSAVTIKAKAQDTLGKDPVVALVRGRATGGPAGMALPAVWHEHFGKYVIQNITITFTRGSLWFGASQNAVSNLLAMPGILTATFGSTAAHNTPTVAALTGPLNRSVLSLQLGYLLLAPPNHIVVIEGESMTKTGTGTATVTADAAAHASGGSVMRLSAGPASLRLSSVLSANFSANAYQVAVYAVVRVNGTPAAAITMRAALFCNGAQVEGPTVPIDYVYFGTANAPQPVFLGIIDTALPFTSVMVVTEWLDAAITIDIDYLVCVALNNAPDARAVATVIDPNVYTPFGAAATTSPITVTYDPQSLTRPEPAVTGSEATTGTSEPWPISGDAYLVSSADVMTGLWLATQGTFWRPWDTTAGAAISFRLSLTRRAPFLLPQ